MKIILTGASGLIGSRFEELMFENHEIIPLSSSEVNITDKNSILSFLSNKSADVIIHLAAKTDVDGCEEDKSNDLADLKIDKADLPKFDPNTVKSADWSGKNSAFAINTIGTKNLYDVCGEKGMKFVYISTDFVFNGDGEYDEDWTPDPINWYGMTKYYGEGFIDLSKDLIVRLSFPYGYKSPVKDDFVWKLVSLLQSRDDVSLISDQTITPTFIDDIVYGLDFLVSRNSTGIYHLSGSSYEVPFKIGQKIKEKLGLKTQIDTTTREKLYAGKAARPFKSIMKNAKIRDLGFEPKTFYQGLDLILE